MSKPDQTYIAAMVKQALAEDVSSGDITAGLIPSEKKAKATVITREAMVVCGRAWAHEVFKQVDATLMLEWHSKDGDVKNPNDTLFTVAGCARSILTAERCALNFLQMLSATATVTANYVEKLKGTEAKLLDTRKTIPLFRLAQKYAVTCGGGKNHRIGLSDAFLIKENHIAACGSIEKAVIHARSMHDDKLVEVEVESLDEFRQALAAKPDVIMLDNFSDSDIVSAVALKPAGIKLELSGNVDLNSIANYAKLGVDYISVGALTKHVQAIDLSMRLSKL
jgi:nicotinate-nucleotide pyrophosphorylase (carboxylating)